MVNKSSIFVCALLVAAVVARGETAGNPWKALQESFNETPTVQASKRHMNTRDPWAKLRAVYLPFSESEETVALTDPVAGKKISGYLRKVLRPYSTLIENASVRFNIPKEVIGAVIIVESSGNARAKAKTTTAKGLMQTIDATFKEARQHLHAKGIEIASTPYDPHASIMAGSWYLDRMFKEAVSDQKPGVGRRREITSWRRPVEYYYAGPGNGRKNKNIVIVYTGGRRVVIDKGAYSRKVLKWANIMSKS